MYLSCTYLSGELTEGTAAGVTWWTKWSPNAKHAARCATFICTQITVIASDCITSNVFLTSCRPHCLFFTILLPFLLLSRGVLVF